MKPFLFPESLRLILVFAVAAGAGCGTTLPTTCAPACAAGTHCDATLTCVADTPPPPMDMAIPPLPADLTMIPCAPGCKAPTPYCNDQNHCVSCVTNDQCPSGNVCKKIGALTSCIPGCDNDARCGTTDGGAGLRCCNDTCVDAQKDVFNCGGCGTSCAPNMALGVCAGGVCSAGACNSGWGDCNMDPKDGCETNLRTDAKNCKVCGMGCSIPHGVPGCDDNGCYLKACTFGFDDCNQDPTDGCEASVLADTKNCGGCGLDCNNPGLPHGRAGCANAACQITSCDQGWLDCDGVEKNGCETSSVTDSNNCGACNNKCPQGLVCKGGGCTCPNCNIPNASAKCINFVCLFDKCNPGFGDCDNNIKNGCEVDLTADPMNCGACGAVCPMNMPVCVNGACSAASLHWVLVEASACNAWCGGQGGVFVCKGQPWTCDMAHLGGYAWIYSNSQVPPPLNIVANGYGWVSWFCGANGGCRGPGPNAGNCGGGGPNTVWQCVYN